MKRLLFTGYRLVCRPITLAFIIGILAAWLTTANYALRLQWCRPVEPSLGLIGLSANGISCLYSKDESTPYRYWFQGNKPHSPPIEIQVPEVVVFTGAHFFSADGNWYAVNGMYLHKSENYFFVFDTNTGKLVYDIPVQSSAEPACFSGTGDFIVFESNGLQCWDLKQHRRLSEVTHEDFFILNGMVFTQGKDHLYCLGELYEGTQLELKPPKMMQLRAGLSPKNANCFAYSFPQPICPSLGL